MSGIILSLVGLVLSFPFLNYCAILVGRATAVVYVTAFDKFRWFYLLPLGIALVNLKSQTETLIFVEMLTMSISYQISAFKTFQKLNTKNNVA